MLRSQTVQLLLKLGKPLGGSPYISHKIVNFGNGIINFLQSHNLFCHPICNILDYLCLTPTQLHPNTWRITQIHGGSWCHVVSSSGVGWRSWFWAPWSNHSRVSPNPQPSKPMWEHLQLLVHPGIGSFRATVQQNESVKLKLLFCVRQRVGVPGWAGQPAWLSDSCHLVVVGDDKNFRFSTTSKKVS